jgi:hypothetical protein
MSIVPGAPVRGLCYRAARTANVVPLVLLASVACSEVGSEPLVAASMNATTAQQLSGSAGEPVQPVPAVVVRDQQSRPLANVPVTFATSGGGTVNPTTVLTNASGVAHPDAWTLGTTVGTNTLTASASGLPPVAFSATVSPGAIVTLERAAGTDGQSAVVGTAVTIAPAVRAVDQFGNPVPGLPIVFVVATGGGSLASLAAITNVSGEASAGSWTLGTTAGANAVIASIPGGQSAAFTATGVAGPPVSIMKFTGDNQAAYPGRALPINPAVIVHDVYGNPTAGVTVSFTVHTGAGSVSSPAVVTGASGMASVAWTLGAHLGNSLRVSVAGLPLTFFNATGLIPNLTVTLGSPALSPGGTTQAVATLTDNTGAAITGRTVAWATSDEGIATVSSTGTVTAHATGAVCITAIVDGAARCANFQVGGATPKVPGGYVEMEVETTTLTVGGSTQATAVPRTADGDHIVLHGPVHWGSHNHPVAVVTSEGWIIGVSPGQSSISATIDGRTVLRLFTVVP